MAPGPSAVAAAGAVAVALAAAILSATPVGAVLLKRGGEGPRLVAFLDTKARELSSVELTVLAHNAARAGSNPDQMDKVKDMIRNMIADKQADLASSTTQGEYCNKELPKAVAELKKLKEDADRRAADHDALEARAAQLTEDASKIAAEVAGIKKNLTKEEEIRGNQQAAYADLKAGYEAAQPARSDEEIKKQIQVETEEAARELAFKRLQADALVSIKLKEQEAKHIQTDMVKMKAEMAELERDGRLQQDVMDSAKTYKQQLDKQCVVRTESYEERKRRRDEEIESMKDAYVILGGDI